MPDRKLRIFLWCDSFPPEIGGVETICYELAQQYKKYGNEVEVTTTSNGAFKSSEIMQGLNVNRFSRSHIQAMLEEKNSDLLNNLRSLMSDKINAFKPDIFHVHVSGDIKSLYFLSIFKPLIKVPILLTVHVVLNDEFYRKTTIFDLLFKLADRVNCVSNSNAMFLAQKKPLIKEKLMVIPNGLVPSKLPIKPLPKDPIKLLFLGRLVEQKGCDVLIQAFSLVVNSVKNITLVIAGDGVERKKLEELTRELKLEKYIQFLGWIGNDKVPALINESSLVLMPSNYEGLPIVALEAANMARPIIASRVTGLIDIIIDGETGLLINQGDVEGFANAIKLLVADLEKAAYMGECAKKRLDTLFSAEIMTKKYLNVLQEIILRKEEIESTLN